MRSARRVHLLIAVLIVISAALIPLLVKAAAGRAAENWAGPDLWSGTPAALPLVANCASPLRLTYVPPYRSTDDLEGQVAPCITPTAHRIAVYIFVGGWWTKPYFSNPLTTMRDDGTWTTDITTGGNDRFATRIAAFLVPNGYSPPAMSGGQTLPPELDENAAASVIVDRPAVYRTLEFSGRAWNVKTSVAPTGPGPNYFSDLPEDVWVDESGRLHLRIVYRNGAWRCTEVFTTAPLGYGSYTFVLAGPVDQLDQNVVLGLFTWDDTAPQHNYREIDIEFSRWGEETGETAQFVVQPWDRAGNRHHFDAVLTQGVSAHRFVWSADSIDFTSVQGRTFPPAPGDLIESWLYRGRDVPPAGAESARINLWLLNGQAPSDGQAVEVIIESFAFEP